MTSQIIKILLGMPRMLSNNDLEYFWNHPIRFLTRALYLLYFGHGLHIFLLCHPFVYKFLRSQSILGSKFYVNPNQGSIWNELKVPEKPMSKCSRFSYSGSKLFNMLPSSIRENQNPTVFKTLTKKWIWEKNPSQ